MDQRPEKQDDKLLAFLSHRHARRVAWAIVILVIASGVIGGIHRGLHKEPDWESFTAESRYVWQHHAINPATKMFGYLPAAYFFLWPFTVALPQPVGLFAFVATNIAAAIIAIWLVRRFWYRCENGPSTSLFVWPLLIAVAHFQHVLQANQFTALLLALCVIGLALIMKKHDTTGGFMLGLATCLKVTPACFVVFFLLRRQWKAVAGLLAAIVVANVVPSLLVFGVQGTIREHKAWLSRVDAYSNRRFIEDPWLRVVRHRGNCSLAIVLSRWLEAPPDANAQVTLRGDVPPLVVANTRSSLKPDEHLTIDTMPERDHPWSLNRYDLSDHDKYPRFHVAGLSPQTIRWIWWTIVLAATGALCVATWRCRMMPVSHPAFAAQAAVWLAFMLVPSPMMRDYYLALAFPALVVTWCGLIDPLRNRFSAFGRATMTAAILVSIAGVVCLGSNIASWFGLHLVSLILLCTGAAIVWRGWTRMSVNADVLST